MSRDLSHAVPTICRYAVAESLFSIPNCDDALRVTIPGQIIDAPCNLVDAFCCSFSYTIPYSDVTHNITARNIVTGGREAGDGGCSRMLCVLTA